MTSRLYAPAMALVALALPALAHAQATGTGGAVPAAASEPAISAAAPASAPAPAAPALLDSLGLEVAGYIQVDQQWDQSSQDQISQDGKQLNEDLLVVRRGRLWLGRTWERSQIAFEADFNTVDGAAIGVRRAEATLFQPGDQAKLPAIALTAGISDIPFGFELQQSSSKRLFMERSLVSRALFPGEADTGARVWGGWRQFRYAVGLFAGEPIVPGQNLPDPNAAKDLVGRVGADAHPSDDVEIAGGLSLVAGTGFHAGTPATQASVQWIDYNENGQIDPGELVGVPGTAATPSENFRRWAVGADVEAAIELCPGWLRIAAEITVASNLDRGLFVADPIASGTDTRELGGYALVTQELGPAFVGLRFDYYNPNLDALDSRVGALIPVDEAIATLSPLVGARLPWHARVSIEYDYVRDHLARDTIGVPTDLANNRVVARLQVEL